MVIFVAKEILDISVGTMTGELSRGGRVMPRSPGRVLSDGELEAGRVGKERLVVTCYPPQHIHCRTKCTMRTRPQRLRLALSRIS